MARQIVDTDGIFKDDDILEEIKILELTEKKDAINCIKQFEDFQFIEQIEGENVIGYINDHDRTIQVSFLTDNMGRYLELSHSIETDKTNIEKSIPYLSRWIVNGRYKVCNDFIIVYSIFPILDENLMYKQIAHALKEIWDMSTIVNSSIFK